MLTCLNPVIKDFLNTLTNGYKRYLRFEFLNRTESAIFYDRVPRPGFGKNLSEWNSSPPIKYFPRHYITRKKVFAPFFYRPLPLSYPKSLFPLSMIPAQLPNKFWPFYHHLSHITLLFDFEKGPCPLYIFELKKKTSLCLVHYTLLMRWSLFSKAPLLSQKKSSPPYYGPGPCTQ